MVTQPLRIERWTNGGSSTLSSGASATDTTISVSSATSFPTSGDFRVLIGGTTPELATVKAVSGTTFTLTAGLTYAHAISSSVELVACTDGMDRAVKDGFADTDYPFNRILNNATTLTASSFSWFNQGTATCTDADDGGLNMTCPSEAYHQIRGKYLSAPSTPWIVTAYCQLGPGFAMYTGSGTGSYMGLFARESSSGKIYMLPLRDDVFALWRMTDATTFSADVDGYLHSGIGHAWIALEDDGTDINGYLSYDGVNWEMPWSEGRTSFMSGGPDQVGFALSSGNADADAIYHFKTWILES